MRLLTFSSDERLELMAVSGYSHIFSTEVIQPLSRFRCHIPQLRLDDHAYTH